MRHLPLTVVILAFLSGLLLLTWLLFSILAYQTTANDLYSQKADHARMLLKTFTQQLPDDIPTMPVGILPGTSPAALFAENIATDNSFIRLTLLDRNGKAIYSVGKDAADIYQPFINPFVINDSGCTFINSQVRCIAKIGTGNTNIATAGITLSLHDENMRLERSRRLYLSYFIIDFILLVGLGAFILSRIVIKPLHRLLAATEKITTGQYGQQMRISGSSELSNLAQAFNAMSTTLQFKEEEVQKHLKALKQTNLELENAREETLRSEKMASIGLLAAGMAHEIGTPLASIIGYAEMVSSEQLDTATTKEFARRISTDCSRIDRIVRGLLQYAQPNHSIVKSCAIKPLLKETMELLAEQGVLKKMQVSLAIDDFLPEVCADPHQLQQVLINLLINSRDAMPDGGSLSIKAGLTDIEDRHENIKKQLEISMTDSGCGISPANLQHIFDPFFTTKEPGKGTGLGLAISARIIESFGGSINAKSKLNGGTTINILLELAE